MITLDVEQILSESHKYNETGQSDFLSELILDFYKNGQYSYSQYKDEKLRKEKIEMKTEINKLQYQLSSFKQSDIDIKEKAIQNEVELRLDHYVSARDERIQKQSQRIQTLTAEVLRYERLETEAKLLSRNSNDEEHTEQKDFINELKKKKKKKHSISSSESDSD